MDNEDRHYSLYKFRHKKSNVVFFGRGKTPRDCVEDLAEVINHKPRATSDERVKLTHQGIIDAGLLDLVGFRYRRDDWEVTRQLHGISRIEYIVLVDLFASLIKEAGNQTVLVNLKRHRIGKTSLEYRRVNFLEI